MLHFIPLPLTFPQMNTISSPLVRHPQLRISTAKASAFFDPYATEIIAFQKELLSALEHAAPGTVIPISYEGITLSASCQAATIGLALLEIVKGTYEDRFITVLDPDGTNDWDADAGLKKESARTQQKLVCVWHGPADKISLQGAVDPQVEATYAFVAKEAEAHEGATARLFAEREGITIQAASNRMSKAAKLGLIYKSEEISVEGGGKQHIYVPIE